MPVGKRVDLPPDPYIRPVSKDSDTSRVKEPKRFETISTTVRTEMQRRDRAYAFQTVPQTLGTATSTALLWGGEKYDQGGLHDITANTSKITIQSGGDAGVWLFAAQVAWAGAAVPAGYREVIILQNGGVIVARIVLPPVAIAATQTVMSLVGFVNEPLVGDFFEVFALHTQGVNLQVVDGFFSAIQLW